MSTDIPPIIITRDGRILDGHYRYYALLSLGLPITLEYGDEDVPIPATIWRDEQGRCLCGSTAGDEFHCPDCGTEVGPS